MKNNILIYKQFNFLLMTTLKMKKLVLALFCGTIMSSCSSDESIISENSFNNNSSTKIQIEDMIIEKSDNILKFNSYNHLLEAADKLKTGNNYLNIAGKTKSIIKEDTKIDGFHSLYDDYVEALDEADLYYGSIEEYNVFKNKYSNLFFPEHNDDYSVYLPVSNREIAKLLNSKGEIEIEGKIINLKDITSYEQLVDLGETMEENHIITKDITGNFLNGFPEQTSQGDRRLKCRVYTQPGSSGVYEEIVVDVSFRKKGAFGAWYNYNSNTSLGFVNGNIWSKSGFSSHDYKFARTFTNGVPVKFVGRMFVDFQGFRGEKVFFDVNI